MAFVEDTSNQRRRALQNQSVQQAIQGLAQIESAQEGQRARALQERQILEQQQQKNFNQAVQLENLRLNQQKVASSDESNRLKRLEQKEQRRQQNVVRAAELVNKGVSPDDAITQLGLQGELDKSVLESVAKGGASPLQRLSKLSGEQRKAVGSVATGIRSINKLTDALQKGVGPQRVDSNTPVVGAFISDNEFTTNQRILSEMIGRLQSGGAINKEEEVRFKALIPRAADSPEAKVTKLGQLRGILADKGQAFGFQESELEEAGFNLGPRTIIKDQTLAQEDTSLGGLRDQVATPQSVQALGTGQQSTGATPFSGLDINQLNARREELLRKAQGGQ